MRTVLAASTIALSTLLAAPSPSWATDAKAQPAGASAGKIVLSFKIDPRVLGPTYGGEHWVSPPTYTGARAQDAVEAMARAVDAKGAPVRTEPEWSVSDPELLAVSPPRGKRVTLTAKRPGTSQVTVKAGGASKTFTLKAEKPNGNWQLTVSQ
jgi:Pilus formation protein N terminal region